MPDLTKANLIRENDRLKLERNKLERELRRRGNCPLCALKKIISRIFGITA